MAEFKEEFKLTLSEEFSKWEARFKEEHNIDPIPLEAFMAGWKRCAELIEELINEV